GKRSARRELRPALGAIAQVALGSLPREVRQRSVDVRGEIRRRQMLAGRHRRSELQGKPKNSHITVERPWRMKLRILITGWRSRCRVGAARCEDPRAGR